MTMTDELGDDRRRLSNKPLNAQIAEAIGFDVWPDPRPDRDGWFQERPHPTAAGMIQVGPVPDYVGYLKQAVETVICH
jgi:hypothetical protein